MGHSRLFLQDPEYKLYFNYEILCLFYKLVLCLTACDSDNHHKLVNVLGLLCSKLLFAIFASKGWMVVISVWHAVGTICLLIYTLQLYA
jgi:hypothetical protein